MRVIRLIQKPQNGQITFSVPDEMRDETIIIEFRPVKEESQLKVETLNVLKELRQTYSIIC
jgi:hypothetical protein